MLIIAACNGNANYSSIPDTPVSIQINPNVYYPHLNGVNANQCFTAEDINLNEHNRDKLIRATGYGGVLIHTVPSSDPNNLAGIEYHAFDMACPNEADKNIRVYPEGYPDNKYGAYAVCEKCGSRFDLNSFGMASSKDNPSQENLKRHNATRNSLGIINVLPRYD